jgi:hypothetical protein
MNIADPFLRVKQVARLIRQMSREERAALAQLVPELRPTPAIPTQQVELLAHFQPRLEALTDARPMLDTDPFIEDLNVGKFFALPEAEQDRLWNRAHAEAENEITPNERPVQADAVPA